MNNELKKEIIQIVAKIIKIPADKIDSQANLFTDLGVDSLLAALVAVQVVLGDKLIWIYGLHTVKVVEAMRAGLV